ARREVRRLEALTDALVELRAWLVGAGCTLVVVESTGPYWTLPARCPPTHVGEARRGALEAGPGRSGRRGSGSGRSPGDGWSGCGRRGCGGRPSCARPAGAG